MPKRLCEDHENAKFLGSGLARIPGVQIDPRSVATNIVVFDVSETGSAPAEISARLKARVHECIPTSDFYILDSESSS